MKCSLPFILCSTFSLLMAVATAADAMPRRRLELPPGPGNPRNSEGDFMQLKDGRILYIYTRFNGKDDGDHSAAELAARWSSDRGETWTTEDRIVVKNDGGMNVMSVSLLRTASGRIGLFYLLKNSEYDCRPTLRWSDDEGETWSDPICCLTEPVGYYELNNCRAIQLQNGHHKGRILLSLCRYTLATQRVGFDWNGTLMCAYSDDEGRTWRLGKEFKIYDEQGKRVLGQEPGVIELKDGRILMFIRSNAGCQLLSYSSDDGETWTPPQRSPLYAPESPATMKRLPNGDILCVWNNRDGVPAGVRARVPLTVAISKDEGVTWQYIKNLEANLNGWYCYIAINVVDDSVLLAYCCEGLAHSRITKVPIAWLYTEGPTEKAIVTQDVFTPLPEGPFTRLESSVGVWTAAEGAARVFSYARGKGIHLDGGENMTIELELSKPSRLGDLSWLGAERFTAKPPYYLAVEALRDEKWMKVAEQGGNMRVGVKHPLRFRDPDMTVSRLRFSCTSCEGVIFVNHASNIVLPGFFTD